MSANELSMKVKELRELRRMADELATEIETVQDAIKAHMVALDVDTLSGVDYKITWKTVESSRIDSKSLKAELPELAARFTKVSTTRRFVIV